jgi:uncharacterized protein YciI
VATNRTTRYVLFYESADDVAVRAPAHFPAHVARIHDFAGRGELLGVGVFGDPQADGSMGIFTSKEGAESFAAEDPFVLHGVVRRYEIREWYDLLAAAS